MKDVNITNISEHLSNLVIKKFGCKRNASKVYANLINLKEESAYNIIKNYCSGKLKVDARNFVQHNNFSSLERIAFFYQMLDIDIDDPIIEVTKKINPPFEYPPMIREERECIVNIKFMNEEYVLKKEQKESLERLAIIYAKSNYKK